MPTAISAAHLGDYIRRSGDVDLLTASDERELAETIAAGEAALRRHAEGDRSAAVATAIRRSHAARERFIRANLRLVISMAGKMKRPANVALEDLIQDGNVGLAKAVDRFDPALGFRFSTYATWWIRQAMQRGLEHTAGPIRIPAHRESELRGELRLHDGDAGQLTPALEAVHRLRSVQSLDKVVGDSGQTIGQLIAGDEPDVTETVAATDTGQRLLQLVHQLPTLTAQAIIERFGLDGEPPRTYRTIGEGAGVTAEAARRRVSRGLEDLRLMAAEIDLIDLPRQPTDDDEPATCAA